MELAWGLMGVSVFALILIAVVTLSYLFTIYNGLVLTSNNIAKAWSNIDVLLKQRHDELPKLIAACEGYMMHERGVFDRVLKAREVLMAASGPQAKGVAEGELQASLRQLFALAENYPQLKAQDSFRQLQGRISELESNIADRREFYNDSVNTYNIRIASLPDLLVARMMGLQPHEMYQIEQADRQDIKVEFKPA